MKGRLEASFAAQEKAKVLPGGASDLVEGWIDAVMSAGAQLGADSSDVHPISERYALSRSLETHARNRVEMPLSQFYCYLSSEVA